MFKRSKELDRLSHLAHGEVSKVIDTMQQIADDPDMTDGMLRMTLHNSAKVLVQLNNNGLSLQRYLVRGGRRFFWLTVAYGCLIGYQAADAILRHGWWPW